MMGWVDGLSGQVCWNILGSFKPGARRGVAGLFKQKIQLFLRLAMREQIFFIT